LTAAVCAKLLIRIGHGHLNLSSSYRVVALMISSSSKNSTERVTCQYWHILLQRFFFALSATVASTQTPQPVPQAIPPGLAAQILPSTPANAKTVTHWHGQNVYDPSDVKIGEIMDVLVDRDSKVVALIVAVGGFLGMARKTLRFLSMRYSSGRKTATSGIPP
jgi:hypothetical protein